MWIISSESNMNVLKVIEKIKSYATPVMSRRPGYRRSDIFNCKKYIVILC